MNRVQVFLWFLGWLLFLAGVGVGLTIHRVFHELLFYWLQRAHG